MQPFPSTGPVVVGIDGSEASLGAAEWAVNEAASRDVALRLVFAAPNATTQGGDDLDLEYGEQALRTASAAIEALGTPIKLETAIRCGPPATVLVEESSSADLICVGSVGIGPVAAAVLGSTAAEVAGQAHCPVAIIRRDPQRPATRSDWIAVAVNASRENELVIETALELARRHQLRVLASPRIGRKTSALPSTTNSTGVWQPGSNATRTSTSTPWPRDPPSRTIWPATTSRYAWWSSVRKTPARSRPSSVPTPTRSSLTATALCLSPAADPHTPVMQPHERVIDVRNR